MKLIVLGANGRTGKLVVKAALDRGMHVTAMVRSTNKAPSFDRHRLTTVIGDPCDPDVLARAFKEQDVVISTLGGRRPTQAATVIYVRSAEAIVQAAQGADLKRVLVTSSALLFPARTLLDKLLRAIVPNVVRSAGRMEAVLADAQIQWISARCGFLNDEPSNAYRTEFGRLPENGAAVSRTALAAFLLDTAAKADAPTGVFGVSRADA
jgi:putative NADH-flavin reductase